MIERLEWCGSSVISDHGWRSRRHQNHTSFYRKLATRVHCREHQRDDKSIVRSMKSKFPCTPTLSHHKFTDILPCTTLSHTYPLQDEASFPTRSSSRSFLRCSHRRCLWGKRLLLIVSTSRKILVTSYRYRIWVSIRWFIIHQCAVDIALLLLSCACVMTNLIVTRFH